jgi:hypothetical protein
LIKDHYLAILKKQLSKANDKWIGALTKTPTMKFEFLKADILIY